MCAIHVIVHKKKASLSLQFSLLFGSVVSVDFTATKRRIKVS